MHPKVMRMRRLINEGFTLATIRSDTHSIEARLSDTTGVRVTVSFDERDAVRLLYDKDSFGADAREEAPTDASRWRVTRPLR